MLEIEIFFGHSASQAPVLVQLPKPSSSIFATIAFTRLAASTFPCGNKDKTISALIFDVKFFLFSIAVVKITIIFYCSVFFIS